MAKETAATVTAWRKTETKVELEDTGDILIPLRRMYEYYVQKSCKLYQQAAENPENPEKRANIIKNADYYKRAAESVMAVINQ
jgi:hypothetical protein